MSKLHNMEKNAFKNTLTFGTLCILAGALVMTIYWIERSNQKQESVKTVEIEHGNKYGCPMNLINDGFCDDEANTEECNFDFGDCCDWRNDFSNCQDCFCYTEPINYTNKCGKNWYEHGTFPHNEFLGNGHCDLHLNTVDFFFDAGDCCLDKSEDNVFCIKSDRYCIQNEIGDGVCQDHNNSPLCDYDLGDCCFPPKELNKNFCCDCSCSQVTGTINK